MIRHVDAELHDLKNLILSMGGCVEKVIEDVCLGVINRSPERFRSVYAQEKIINDLHLKVDLACMNILAKQAPVATDLRLVIAAIKINTDLERMGDQAVNIAHNGEEYLEQETLLQAADFKQMSKEVRHMVKVALDAFVKMDVNLSRQVLDHDDVVDQFRNKIVDSLKEEMQRNINSLTGCLNLIRIARNLERLADHATNIAEEVIFIATGDDIRHGKLGQA